MDNIVQVQQIENKITANEFKEYLDSCLDSISQVSRKMSEIKEQGGWAAYWSRAENIRHIAHHVDVLSTVLQKILELSTLIMNGSINIKKDYSVIMAILNEYNDNYADQLEVVQALNRFRSMVSDLKARDDLLDELVTSVNDLDIQQLDLLSKLQSIDSNILQLSKDQDKVSNNLTQKIRQSEREQNSISRSLNDDLNAKLEALNKLINEGFERITERNKKVNIKYIVSMIILYVLTLSAIALMLIR